MKGEGEEGCRKRGSKEGKKRKAGKERRERGENEGKGGTRHTNPNLLPAPLPSVPAVANMLLHHCPNT